MGKLSLLGGQNSHKNTTSYNSQGRQEISLSGLTFPPNPSVGEAIGLNRTHVNLA
ncbi:MAG: hypothetical protein U7126_17150 [Microcoleus sp.]